MAKVAFSKLQATVKDSPIICTYANKTGELIEYEVKTYLPFEQKLVLVSNIINQSMDDNGFYNPMRVDMYLTLEIIYAYTNLSFTEKMKEDAFKLYDLVIGTGIYNTIINAIGDDYDIIVKNTYSTIENIYKYKNSVLGIIKSVANNYENLNLDLTAIQDKLADPNSLNLIKEILPMTNASMA